MNKKYQIHFDSVEVSYPQPGGDRFVVFRDLNLFINPGEIVSLVGPSGCGKSTVLRAILGSQFPTKGTVSFNGAPVTRVGRDRGVVYQNYSLYPHLSVLDNIAQGIVLERSSIPERLLHLKSFFRTRQEARARAGEVLSRIGLSTKDAQKHPFELSGGMRQRVAIAQALIMEPEVLLMDEPFGALDHNTKEDMQLFLLEQQEEHGMTVVFVTHDLEEALFVGTRIIGLSQYWRDESGGDGIGSAIVSDRKIEGAHPRPTDFKYTEKFRNLLREVRRDTLDSAHRQHVRDFNHDHEDSYHPMNGFLSEPSKKVV